MEAKYELEQSAVLYEGVAELGKHHVSTFLRMALNKRLRKASAHDSFMQDLDAYGEAELSWNFTRRIKKRDDHWATLRAWKNDTSYSLYCVGPQAENVLEKVTTLMERLAHLPRREKRSRKKFVQANRTRRRSRRLATKRKRLVTQQANRATQQPKQKKVRRISSAPISLERNELLTPQFRKNRIFWREAIAMTVAAFQVHGNWKRSARELAAGELYDSLERSGYRFAQYKRNGFCLRFDLVDGIYRGEITPISVACTKDNRHPTYRRLRNQLRNKLLGLSPKEQRKRRVVLWSPEDQVAA